MRPQILKILEHLDNDEFKKFKWMLENQQPNDFITKHALDGATREDTVNLLVERYPSEYCEILRTVLEECGRNDLATQLLSCEYCLHTSLRIRFGCLLIFFMQRILSTSQFRLCVTQGSQKKGLNLAISYPIKRGFSPT